MTITDGQILAIMASVVGGLITAIKYLNDRVSRMQDRVSLAAEKCEKERFDLSEKIGRLEERMDGCPVKSCPNRPSQSWRLDDFKHEPKAIK
jgi:ribosomal protein S2